MLKKWLAHPLTKGLNIDSPQTTEMRKLIIEEKSFLKQIYHEWYKKIISSFPTGIGLVLELGSGAGFLKEYQQNIITTELFYCQGISAVIDGQQLPFRKDSLDAIVMIDVFHHFPQPRRFLKEATRCIRTGGVITMIEPWITPWSYWVLKRFHNEPVLPDSEEWECAEAGPLSGANQALPWIVFERDRSVFNQEFPSWEIQDMEPFMPLRYLLSGGISLRSLMPGWSFGFWRLVEDVFSPWMPRIGMFAHIVLRKTQDSI